GLDVPLREAHQRPVDTEQARLRAREQRSKRLAAGKSRLDLALALIEDDWGPAWYSRSRARLWCTSSAPVARISSPKLSSSKSTPPIASRTSWRGSTRIS